MLQLVLQLDARLVAVTEKDSLNTELRIRDRRGIDTMFFWPCLRVVSRGMR